MKHKSRTVTMILCVILLIAFFLAALALCQYINYRQLEQEIPEVWYPTLYVYKTNDGYKIYRYDNNHLSGTVRLDSDGSILRTWKTKLVQIDDPASLIGQSLTDITAQYGPPHTDIGSGFYIPAYITEDAQLIALHEDGENNIFLIIIRDLCTNTVVDKIYATDISPKE